MCLVLWLLLRMGQHSSSAKISFTFVHQLEFTDSVRPTDTITWCYLTTQSVSKLTHKYEKLAKLTVLLNSGSNFPSSFTCDNLFFFK